MDAVLQPADKQSLRRSIKARCRELDPETVRSKSGRIQATVMGLSQFEEAANVACYLSTGQEVMTDRLIEACRDAGKTVAVPARVPSEGRYRLSRLRRDTRLVTGALGIQEPAAPEWIDESTVGLFLVPGVAFDADGGRLGHGGGHYDRLLCGDTPGPAFKIGLAFDCQIVAAVPMEPMDVRMDAVVTESGILEAKNKT